VKERFFVLGDGIVSGWLCPDTHRNICIIYVSRGWWRGVVGNAFRLKRSYSTTGPVSTAMGDHLWASRCEACQLGRLSLLPSVRR